MRCASPSSLTLNNKTLNSEIETNLLELAHFFDERLSITRLSILRLKHLFLVILPVKIRTALNNKTLNSEIETIAIAGIGVVPFQTLNNKTLNSEIETVYCSSLMI